MLMNRTILVDSIRCWLLEDIGKFDLTTELIVAPGIQGRFNFVSREKIVMAGLDVINTVFEVLSTNLKFKQFCKDSDSISPGFKIACVSGNASQILEGERLALNLLQRMCGIATTTSEYVAKIAHTNARLVDTRKTTPGLRLLEKYAFFCGGGHNHRYSLDAGVMLKDNHISIVGSIKDAVKLVRGRVPLLTKIEVECEDLSQVQEALDAGVDLIMLDNMSNEKMVEAVKLVDGRLPLECSGGVNFQNVGEKAETGVDYISVGAITQSAKCVDIGLDA